MRFSKQEMIDLAFDDHDTSRFEVLKRKIVDQHRWVTVYSIIFKYGDQFFRSYYDMGSTESQENEPYEYGADENGFIDCEEVFPKQVLKTIYVNAPPKS